MELNIKDIVKYILKETDNEDDWYIDGVMYYAEYKSIELYYDSIFWGKWFNVGGMPKHSSIIAEINFKYKYDVNTNDVPLRTLLLIKLSIIEFEDFKRILGSDGLKLFIKDICDIQGKPCIDAELIAYYTCKGRPRKKREFAFAKLNENKRLKNK